MGVQQNLLAILLVVSSGLSAAAQPIFFGDPITVDTIIDASTPYPGGFGAYDAGSGSPMVELVDGGSVGGWASLFDESRFLMSGGSVGRPVVVADNAVFTMTGGVVGEEIPPTLDVADIVGEGSGTIHLRGGRLATGYIQLYQATNLNVYGTNLQLTTSGDGLFWVTGQLQDGTPLNVVGARGGPGNSVTVHNVPEPATWLMSSAAAVMLQRQRTLPRVAPSC
jgi:hypothetical protein